MSYSDVAAHRSMAFDARRNAAYAAALERVVDDSSVVLDVGAGTGIHGLIAARLGARAVYLVEPEPVIGVAADVARANGWEDRVHCLQARMEDVTLPEPVDVIVSALTGNFLLTEDLLPLVQCAREAALRPGGVLVPGAARMEAVPVCAPALHQQEVATWSQPCAGIDLSAGRAYAANTLFYRTTELADAKYLATPRVLHTVDLYRDGYDVVSADVEYVVTRTGLCHGWVGWVSVRLIDQWLSTSPKDAALHWSQAFLPLDPPLAFEAGQTVTFSLRRAPYGDWSWQVRSPAGNQQHSTLLSMPLTPATIQKADMGHRPELTPVGHDAAFVLAACNGKAAIEDIAQSLIDRTPDRYLDTAAAVRFVQRLVRQYA